MKIIARALEESDDDGWINLGIVGARIFGTTPDFDPRTYGCPNLSRLATKSGGFEIQKSPGNAVHIRRKAQEKPKGRKAR